MSQQNTAVLFAPPPLMQKNLKVIPTNVAYVVASADKVMPTAKKESAPEPDDGLFQGHLVMDLDEGSNSNSVDSDSNTSLTDACDLVMTNGLSLAPDFCVNNFEDDELTSLTWLQDSNLLKNITGSTCGSDGCSLDGDDEDFENLQMSLGIHPHNVPYHPRLHAHNKPPYSFSCLIFMAIEESPVRRLPVKDIYTWIVSHFPYFINAPTGWKNSVRHNLSLNKCFKKVEKDKGHNIGKGSLWMVDPQFRPNLLQALRKTPYHPYHQLHALRATSNSQSSPDDLPYGSKGYYQAQRQNVNLPPPDLFPLLSKRLAASSIKSEVSDFDAAAAMLSLKHANERKRSPFPVNLWRRNSRGVLEKVRHYRPKRKRPLVVTHSPYDDHTYSVAEDTEQDRHCSSPTSSIDEEFDFGSDCDTDSEMSEYTDSDSATSSPGKRKLLKDEEDEKKKTEGADALLNLAGIATPMSDVGSMFNMSSELVPPSSTDVIVSTTAPSNDSDAVPGADALLRLAGVTSNIVPLRSISPTNNNNIEVKNELHLDTCCLDEKGSL